MAENNDSQAPIMQAGGPLSTQASTYILDDALELPIESRPVVVEECRGACPNEPSNLRAQPIFSLPRAMDDTSPPAQTHTSRVYETHSSLIPDELAKGGLVNLKGEGVKAERRLRQLFHIQG
jgi:hypothetical protein